MQTPTLVLLIACVFAPVSAFAKLSSVLLDRMVEVSDHIVYATVTGVTSSKVNGCTIKHATVAVSKVLKGPVVANLQYDAPIGDCWDYSESTSDAQVGESILLFLQKQNSTLVISVWGRGRMAIRQSAGRTYATLTPDVLLSKEAPTIPGPDAKQPWIKSVELGYLEREIALLVHPNPSLERP